jgi:hypothetical protein
MIKQTQDASLSLAPLFTIYPIISPHGLFISDGHTNAAVREYRDLTDDKQATLMAARVDNLILALQALSIKHSESVGDGRSGFVSMR